MSELAKNTSDQIESQNPTDRTAKTPNYPALNSNNLESTLCFPKDIFYAVFLKLIFCYFGVLLNNMQINERNLLMLTLS